jgi:hypothetical protein
MKREPLTKLNRQANEGGLSFGTFQPNREGFGTVERKESESDGQGID